MGSDPKTEAGRDCDGSCGPEHSTTHMTLTGDTDDLMVRLSNEGDPRFADVAGRAYIRIRTLQQALAARLVSPADREGPWAALERLVSSAVPPDALMNPDLDVSGNTAHRNLYDWWHERCAPALMAAREVLAARLGQREDAPLDAAWREAEAVLPEGWAITVLSTYTTPHEYLVSAMNRRDGLRATEGLPTEDEPVVVEREGLPAALQALAARLRESQP